MCPGKGTLLSDFESVPSDSWEQVRKLGLGTRQEGEQVGKQVLWCLEREWPTGNGQEMWVGLGNKVARGQEAAERSVWQFQDTYTTYLP